jgi:hypothetical protein
MTVQILEAQDVSNSQGNNDAKLRRFAATARNRQESGVHAPSALRQAAPRVVVSRPETVSVWLYCRQFCEPT